MFVTSLYAGDAISRLRLLPGITVNQVIKRFLAGLLQERAEVHIATNAEVTVVLLLDGRDIRVVPFIP